MRIGHLSLRVTDMEKARHHYETVIGLIETHRDEDGTTYFKAWDEWDKYSVILNEAEYPGINYVAYKVETDSDLDSFKKRIGDRGIAVDDVAQGEIRSTGRGIRFILPSGHKMVLFAEKEIVGKSVGALNPDPWPDDIRGCGVMHLDHTLLVTELNPEARVNKVAEVASFFQEVLDFKLTEQIMVGPGNSIQAGAFLSCSSKPHDIAFVGGERVGFHHMAFFIESWSDVLKAADVLSKNKVRIDVSPTRHGITRGQTTYFFDPSGNRNETFAGLGYFVTKDMPTITWTEDHLGQAIFYHSREASPSFSGVYTEGA
jgi:catechol 2,3-dioxygenase